MTSSLSLLKMVERKLTWVENVPKGVVFWVELMSGERCYRGWNLSARMDLQPCVTVLLIKCVKAVMF